MFGILKIVDDPLFIINPDINKGGRKDELHGKIHGKV